MDYLKKELNKFLPLALLFGAIGGVLLILVANLWEPNKFILLISYAMITIISVYALNRMRYRKEVGGSLIYGFVVYLVMTCIAFVDVQLNVNPNFYNPLFEQFGFFILILVGTFALSGAVVYLFRRQLIS